MAKIVASSRRKHKICKIFASDSQALCGWAVVVAVAIQAASCASIGGRPAGSLLNGRGFPP